MLWHDLVYIALIWVGSLGPKKCIQVTIGMSLNLQPWLCLAEYVVFLFLFASLCFGFEQVPNLKLPRAISFAVVVMSRSHVNFITSRNQACLQEVASSIAEVRTNGGRPESEGGCWLISVIYSLPEYFISQGS